MELHRLDGIPVGGIDILDIQSPDGDMGTVESPLKGPLQDGTDGLGPVQDPKIVLTFTGRDGNTYHADADENIYLALDGPGLDGFFKKIGKGIKKFSKKVGKAAGKVGKAFNRFVNPATILLRNGFLAAMKLNMFKVPERLRFGYLSDDEARRRGMDPNGFAKLKKVSEKAHKIYTAAGGKESNLRKAILTGKGNRDRLVALSGIGLNGLGLSPDLDPDDRFNDEFERFIVEADADTVEMALSGQVQVEGIGAVAETGTAVASGVVAALGTALSKVQGVFDRAKPVADSARTLVDSGRSLFDTGRDIRNTIRDIAPRPVPTDAMAPDLPPPTSPQGIGAKESRPEGESWAQRNKWLLIGGTVVFVGGGIGYAYYRNKKNQEEAKKKIPKTKRSLNGPPKRTYKRKAVKGRTANSGNAMASKLLL